MLTSQARELVMNELKSIGTDLNLSDEQKQKVQHFMTEASEKIQEYKEQNPSASKGDLINKIEENRSMMRERLEQFLTPEQLDKWDARVATAKDFLGQKLAA